VDPIKRAVTRKARECGFDAVGFTATDPDKKDAANLARFLAGGLNGDMAWMARKPELRSDPRALWPEARTVIALGASYAPQGDPLAALESPDKGAISVYARGCDYHLVLKKGLKALGRWMAETHDCQVKVFVDTAPVMEKPLARRAGLGWQGKHTNLVSRLFGSWLFLGEVFTTLEIDPDIPEADHCGSCDRCRQACPTDALPEPYRMDPGRCISYLTIEHKGAIEPELMGLMGSRVYGCDDCLAVCPWNKFAPAGRDFGSGPGDLGLAHLAGLDDAAFRVMFSGTPVKRTGRDRFVRNVLIAIGNSADPALADAARARLEDSSPLVRGAAAWALGRLQVGAPGVRAAKGA
jgi:epoxyqueuosine reductase